MARIYAEWEAELKMAEAKQRVQQLNKRIAEVYDSLKGKDLRLELAKLIVKFEEHEHDNSMTARY